MMYRCQRIFLVRVFFYGKGSQVFLCMFVVQCFFLFLKNVLDWIINYVYDYFSYG